MDTTNLVRLDDYRLTYRKSIVGLDVFWENVFARIARLLEDHEGGAYGQVRLINPDNGGRVMGVACISDLTPCVHRDFPIPSGLVAKSDHALDDSGDDGNVSSDNEEDATTTATRADIKRLDRKIQKMLLFLHKLAQ